MTRRLFIAGLASAAVLASAFLLWRARTGRVRDGSLPMNAGYKVSAAEEQHLARLANAGDSAAAFALAEAFSIGTPDYEKHRAWLKCAAELGHVVAEYNFGYLLWREGSFTEARTWLLTARAHAEQTGDTFTAHLATGVLAELPNGPSTPGAPDTRPVPTVGILVRPTHK